MPSPRVAFLGIGLMGASMASNIARADLPTTVWNRTPEKAQQMAEAGVLVANTAAEAVADADVVCTMVTNAEAVEEILFARRVAEAMKPRAIFVDMSSIPPKVEKVHAQRLAGMGLRHLDAPVSGGTRGAAEANLAIMVGGDKDTFVDATPVLAAMGRPTRVGPDGAGQLAKLCNQAIVAIGVGGLSEAMLLAAAGGADPTSVREALRGGFSESRILHEHGQRILDRNWMPGGQVRNILKDLNALVEAATDCGLELPFVNLARSLFQSLHDRGVTGYDHTALLLEIEHRNPPHRVGDKPDIAPH
ncbi:NAD(P)-dependent oxidoreductase [Thalassobaculum sp.]|uniref:NAD(P)-dependent oxidoreductase n=1 Tax=Thalassobaculum sp. TaxID=2022740 RepID=UPI0032EBFB6C